MTIFYILSIYQTKNKSKSNIYTNILPVFDLNQRVYEKLFSDKKDKAKHLVLIKMDRDAFNQFLCDGVTGDNIDSFRANRISSV